MSAPVRPQGPNIEHELAKLANDAIAAGNDPQYVTETLRKQIAYLRRYPKVAADATAALADGHATVADITRQLAPHAEAVDNALQVPDAEPPPPQHPLARVGETAVRHLANVAQGIPGGKLAQTGLRMLTRGQSREEAYDDITRDVEQIPAGVKYAERILGGIPVASVLPGSAIQAGALVGGATEALNADPDVELGERVLRTGAGAAGGGLLGKGASMVSTAARSLGAPNTAKLLLGKNAERAESARQLYGAAMKEGLSGDTNTPQIQRFLAEPDIAEIVAELQTTRQFDDLPAHAPEMLDAIYKVLSDRAGVVKKGLASVSPNRPNIGRFKGEDIRAAQRQALSALRGSRSSPGPMPTYPKAVEDFSQRTREIEAIQRGYDVIRQASSDYLPTAKNLTRKGPEAFLDWAAKASPEELAAARQGISGGVKAQFGRGGLTMKPYRTALGEAPELLRATDTPTTEFLRLLRNAGLLTAGDLASPP